MMPVFEASAFAVLETDNQFVTWDFIAGWPDACHEHIADAINEWKDSGETPPEYKVVRMYSEDQITAAYEQGKRDASEWQPIETAPKDKERVLIFSEKRGVREARFYTENSDGTVWYDTMVGGGPMTIFYDVTHWMPLPQPPAAAQKGEV